VKPADVSRRQQTLAGWPIVIETYRLGEMYYCSISSADPGARVARAGASSKEEAERVALEKAEHWISKTRRMRSE
jgi:hypothetical protein